MGDDLQIIHNLCLSEMRFDGRIARCLYCEDLDREENARTGVEFARLTAEISEAKELAERYKDALTEIDGWANRAFPEDRWIEPTAEQWKEIDEVLKAAGFSLTCVSGSNMRHALKGVGEIASQALQPEEVK